MNKGEYFVDIVEAYECVNNAMFKDESTQRVFSSESDDFHRGALWGMSWALSHIFAYCPKCVLDCEENGNESKANC